MSSLDAALEENLVQVIMVDREGKEHEVYFSRIAGEESTYRVNEEELMVSGKHSYRYRYFELTDHDVVL